MKDKTVFAEMLAEQKPVRFEVDCGASTNILPYKHVGMWILLLAPSPLFCRMATRSSL